PNDTPAIPRKFPVLAVSWLASAEKKWDRKEKK
ncbi:MAG: hypothetical protein ACI90V_011803, partial [Bacillariaceae sp.]